MHPCNHGINTHIVGRWCIDIYRFPSSTVVNASLLLSRRSKIYSVSTTSCFSGVSLHCPAMHDLRSVCPDAYRPALFIWRPRTALYYLSDHREHVSPCPTARELILLEIPGFRVSNYFPLIWQIWLPPCVLYEYTLARSLRLYTEYCLWQFNPLCWNNSFVVNNRNSKISYIFLFSLILLIEK